ncbi:EAL domain-containing protein [Psychromonas arctica]|uniref:EAL domain-containing protein n=1 Tax=Psychromonas arctica TaxID=168275 RepID=A0ABU9HB91_9GAMM
MTINKQLTILMLLISLFSLIVVACAFKISDAARFHQLNSQHFNYIIELNDLIARYPNAVPDTNVLKNVVKKIQDQPEACVALPSSIDHLLMRMINAESIIGICKKDIKIADDLLESIQLFDQGLISQSVMKMELNVGYKKFRLNSIEFIGPVNKLSNFIVKTSTMMTVILSIVLFLMAFTITKAIRTVVKRMQETKDKLVISEEKNKQLAHKDTLTGLPNRNALDKVINKNILMPDNDKFAVFFIDLDRFKDVNDTKGHAQGDKLLNIIASRLGNMIRDKDSVFRFGGDEFVAIINFSTTNSHKVRDIAERLIKVIADPISLDNTEVYVTASIGISIYPKNAKDAESLVKFADTAMYKAKKEGKNQYLFYQDIFSKDHTRRLSYESQLRTAIAKDQLNIVYQPVVNLNNFATQGTEALLRWQLNEETSVSPDIFIPIAEYSGQIMEIGEWVLRNACQQNKLWRESGASKLNIAVNVSPYQLFNPNFPKLVQKILAEFDIPPHCLDLEITESMTVSNNDVFLKTLNELSEMGVRLLMDDFGTGYSCLSYLRQLPFDVLKIDKSFVSDYDTIASTIIAMGKQLDMKIIAEGVETQSNLNILKQQQCDFAQGYFFQRPVSAEQLDVFKIYNNIKST